MSHVHRLTFIVSVALLTSCAESDDPMALVRGSVASSVADDGSLSAASLTLPFSGSYNGISAAFTITQTGLGRAGHFENNSATNPRAALTAQTAGTSNALYARSSGSGITAYFENTNPSSFASVVFVRGSGTGTLVDAQTSTGSAVRGITASSAGSAGYFSTNNTSNPSSTLTANTNGSGHALEVNTTGSGYAASIRSSNSNSAVPALELLNNGGIGGAAWFRVFGANNASPALRLETQGTGTPLLANQLGSAGSIAVFQADSLNQARIDRNGRGFFNGGTQNNGADVAEAFEVEGPVTSYRPGDVLVISTRSDQRVTRSTEPYSTRVIGVYATKPGILLTERGIDESLDDLVPVGVVGLIPTRVSAENGPIRRGDMLVTARTPGHAMRATPNEVNGVKLYPSGTILGKALQNFAGPGTGMFKVLVNVK